MNPKLLYFLIFVTTIQAANVDNIRIVNVDPPCDSSSDNTKTSGSKLRITPGGSIPTDNVQHINIPHGGHVVISMDPCDGVGKGKNGSDGSDGGIGISQNVLNGNAAIEAANSNSNTKPAPIIKQSITPAGPFIDMPADYIRIHDQIKNQSAVIDAPTLLNSKIKKYIDFVALLKGSGLKSKLKLPRIVFIGNEDEEKYKVIENILKMTMSLPKSNESSVAPTTSTAISTPRFTAPIRFTLINDPNRSIKINGKLVTNLAEGLSPFSAPQDDKTFLLTKEIVEVEISSPEVPTLVFLDLPWKVPDSAEKKSENESTLAVLLHKYLLQPWGLTVAIGQSSLPFSEWNSMKLVRTFDRDLERVYTVGVNPSDQQDELSIALGLQESYPPLKTDSMYYLKSDEVQQELKGYGVCKVAACGREALNIGLQRKLLQIWAALRPDTISIIQSELDRLKSRLSGYESYKAIPKADDKFKALMDQMTPILNERLIFASEDRELDGVTDQSPLDLIKESLFDTASSLADRRTDWATVFSDYQKQIGSLEKIPNLSVNEAAIRKAIGEFKKDGMKYKTINELKRLVLDSQLESLKGPNSRLLETVKSQWKDTIVNGLKSKFSLEAFPSFQTSLLQSASNLLTERFQILSKLSQQIEESDQSSGWIFNFYDNTDSNVWVELMRRENDEEAFKFFVETAANGFTAICRMHATFQPRLIISNLLTKTVVKTVIEDYKKGQEKNLEGLVNLSSEAEKKLKEFSEQAGKIEKLIESLSERSTEKK